MSIVVTSIDIALSLSAIHVGTCEEIFYPQFLDRPKDHGLYFIKDVRVLSKIKKSILATSFFLIEDDQNVSSLNSFISYALVSDCRIAYTDVSLAIWGDQPLRNTDDLKWINERVNHRPQTIVGENTVIQDNVYIGENVKIGCNCLIGQGTIIKDNVLIESNCVIGQTGFWFTFDQVMDRYKRLPQTGYVVISENCIIGSFANIDRGLNNTRNTILEKNVLMNDKVHVAHGVNIGERTIISAGVKICGEVTIGRNCWIATGVCIHHMTEINSDIIVGMNSTVTYSLNKKGKYFGSPAKFRDEL